jgi:hypothetical protein
MRKLVLMTFLTMPLTGPTLGCTSAQADESKALHTIADGRTGIAQAIDLGEPGDSPGDMFVFDQPLLDKNKEPLGTNSGFCVRTLPGQFNECQWTLTMTSDGSTITVAGREADKGASTIPILGGTGIYTGARGVLVTTPNGDKTFTQVLTITTSP